MKSWRLTSRSLTDRTQVLSERFFDDEAAARLALQDAADHAREHGGCLELEFRGERIERFVARARND